MSSLQDQIHQIGKNARAASRALARLDSKTKNAVLVAMADELIVRLPDILEANAADVAEAEKNGLTKASIDRLRLNEKRVADMADGIRQVAALPDPVGEILRDWTQPSGIQLQKIRTPIGVIGIIYESRPNVTADAAVLCIKTGNAVILRGGSEALASNLAIAKALQAGGFNAGLPDYSVQLIPTKDREAVKIMAAMDQFMDVIIPRGGHSLIEAVVAAARARGVFLLTDHDLLNLDLAALIVEEHPALAGRVIARVDDIGLMRILHDRIPTMCSQVVNLQRLAVQRLDGEQRRAFDVFVGLDCLGLIGGDEADVRYPDRVSRQPECHLREHLTRFAFVGGPQ